MRMYITIGLTPLSHIVSSCIKNSPMAFQLVKSDIENRLYETDRV